MAQGARYHQWPIVAKSAGPATAISSAQSVIDSTGYRPSAAAAITELLFNFAKQSNEFALQQGVDGAMDTLQQTQNLRTIRTRTPVHRPSSIAIRQLLNVLNLLRQSLLVGAPARVHPIRASMKNRL